MNIEQLTLPTRRQSTPGSVYQRVEALMTQAARDGRLTAAEEEIIVAAITCPGQPNADICGLFRRLQERVWDGELKLDRPHR